MLCRAGSVRSVTRRSWTLEHPITAASAKAAPAVIVKFNVLVFMAVPLHFVSCLVVEGNG
jgi:hypothetical protein